MRKLFGMLSSNCNRTAQAATLLFAGERGKKLLEVRHTLFAEG